MISALAGSRYQCCSQWAPELECKMPASLLAALENCDCIVRSEHDVITRIELH